MSYMKRMMIVIQRDWKREGKGTKRLTSLLLNLSILTPLEPQTEPKVFKGLILSVHKILNPLKSIKRKIKYGSEIEIINNLR